MAKRIFKIFQLVVGTEIGIAFIESRSALYSLSFTNICVLKSNISTCKNVA